MGSTCTVAALLTVVTFCGIRPASRSHASTPPQSPTSQLPRPSASNAQPVRGVQLPIQPSGTLTLTLAPARSSKPPLATGMLLLVEGQTVKLQALDRVKTRPLPHPHQAQRTGSAAAHRQHRSKGGRQTGSLTGHPLGGPALCALRRRQIPAGAWRSCCRPAAAHHWHTLRVLLQPNPLHRTGERATSKRCLQQLCLPSRLEGAATEQAVQWFALLLCASQLLWQAEPSRASTAHLQVRLQAPKLLL